MAQDIPQKQGAARPREIRISLTHNLVISNPEDCLTMIQALQDTAVFVHRCAKRAAMRGAAAQFEELLTKLAAHVKAPGK